MLPFDESVRAEPWRLTRERAVYLSVIFHLLILLLALTTPIFKFKPKKEGEPQPDPLGLIALMTAPPREAPIPVQFFPAPGAQTDKPGPRPLPSDKNRQAHGGDPKLPKADTPKAVPLPGIRDLDAGKRGERAKEPAAAPPAEKGSPQGEIPTDALASTQPSLRERRGNNGASDQPVKRLSGIPQPALASLTAEKAARAAQAVGEGDEGGGYERDGGFADSGPLSFDTVGYDWGAYAAEMIRRIKRHWEIPSIAHYGLKGRVTIRFFINKNGTVDGEAILASSGKPPFDNAAFQAIARSSAFRPLPADLGHDREGVTITFFYNMRPEDGYSDEPAPKNPLLPRGRRSGS
ncbi:MAG: energy transducer TonB [Thermoanaerobaculia bacterium]